MQIAWGPVSMACLVSLDLSPNKSLTALHDDGMIVLRHGTKDFLGTGRIVVVLKNVGMSVKTFG